MKGMFFKGNQEYRITVEGEQWKQGAEVKGQLQIRSHSPGASSDATFFVGLARANEKKVKAKAEDAFDVLDIRESQPNAQVLEWSFQLTEKSPVSDANKSLYLIYGPQLEGRVVASGQVGALQLKVLPHQHLEDLISVLSTTFRFPVKKVGAPGAAGAKGAIEVRLDPPEGRSFASTDALVVDFSFEQSADPFEGEIQTGFCFQVRELDGFRGSTQEKKVEKRVERVLPLGDLLHRFNGRVNREYFEKVFQNVLSEVFPSRGV